MGIEVGALCNNCHGAYYLTNRFGNTGLRIVQRIIGLIVMVIAVQFVIDGVETIVKDWFKLV